MLVCCQWDQDDQFFSRGSLQGQQMVSAFPQCYPGSQTHSHTTVKVAGFLYNGLSHCVFCRALFKTSKILYGVENTELFAKKCHFFSISLPREPIVQISICLCPKVQMFLTLVINQTCLCLTH